MKKSEDMNIDIVVMWVDGDDPRFQDKKRKYLTDANEDGNEDIGGPTRYSNAGEIEFCIASINRFAPFIRKIFIITDEQDPHIEKLVAKHFPEGLIPMEIIDHKIIFRGYENYLPTFNSRALETMMWRIPDLSEKFILMNDDFFLTAPLKPEDFFSGDKTITYSEWYPAFWARFLRSIRLQRHGHKHVGFKGSMLNALDIMGGGFRFLRLSHTPRALRRSFFEEFFGSSCTDNGRVSQNEDILLKNIRHRFRDAEQYNSQELFYLNEIKAGRCTVISPKRKALYMKPHPSSRYVDKKLKGFSRNRKASFGCINSLDGTTRTEQQKILTWIRRHIYN